MSVYWNQSAITSSLAVFGRGDVKDDDVKQLSKIEFPSGLTICYGIELISIVNRAIVADEITIAPSVFSIRDGFIPVDSKGMVTYKSYVFLNTKKVWVRGVSGSYAEE